MDTGCFVPISHKLNQDGYFRKSWGNDRTGDRVMEMFHRTIYQMHFGPVPEGYEVDHMCNVRACCNPDHLRAMDGSEHASHSNRERARRKREEETKRH